MKGTAALVCGALLWCACTGSDTPLEFDPQSVTSQGASATTGSIPKSLRLQFVEGVLNASVHVPALQHPWNLSNFAAVLVDVTNIGASEAALFGRLNGMTSKANTGIAIVPPNQTKTLRINIPRLAPLPHNLSDRFPGMSGVPGQIVSNTWQQPNTSYVEAVWFDAVAPNNAPPDIPVQMVEVSNFRAKLWLAPCGNASSPLDDAVFPFVDTYGQLNYRAWPGKVAQDADLQRQLRQETSDLERHSGPSTWNKFGGWATGPQLDASGSFRLAQWGGKWWLVDPSGRLFWSHGICVVTLSSPTSVQGREHMFERLPVSGNEFTPVKDNLKIKLGPTWQNASATLAHRRLRSWGMNTMASWPDLGIASGQLGSPKDRTPFVVNAASQDAPLLPSGFPDVFSSLFRSAVRAGLQAAKRYADDEYLIGVFFDNELKWPDNTGDDEDLAEAYFSVVASEVRSAFPGKLYLGCKFAGYPSNATGVQRVVAKYTASDTLLPELDVPVLLSEFHVGAMDVGLLSPGLHLASDQQQRAWVYEMYMRSALKLRRVVGAHWFQYRDESVTGRFDGENNNIGWVDVADRPYPDMVSSGRSVGSALYARRNASN